MSNILDKLDSSTLSQKDIERLTSTQKPDFHFLINSRGPVFEFENYKETFESCLFDFFDMCPFVIEYLNEIRYSTTEHTFAFGFCISLDTIDFSRFAKFIRGLFDIKEHFAKSINFEQDLLCVFKNINGYYPNSKENKCEIRLNISNINADPFENQLAKLYQFLFNINTFKFDKNRAICIYDTEHQTSEYRSPVKLIRIKD